jgi:hypothetical protein
LALSFDGANDVVRAGQVAGTGPLTVEAWVRPATNNADGLLVVGADAFNGWSLELSEGRLTFWLSSNQGWFFNQNGSALQTGQWYHVAASYSNGSARTFVNGASSSPTGVSTLSQGPNLSMGGYPGYTFFAGDMDEIRISNVARYSSNFSPPTTAFMPDANTLGLWHFDEGSGQTAADISSSGNHATLGTTGSNDSADPTWTQGFFQ